MPPHAVTLLLACAVLLAVAACVAAGAIAAIAVAVYGARRDGRRALERISGSVAAARELVRRASDPHRAAAPVDGAEPPSPRWADLMNGPSRRG